MKIKFEFFFFEKLSFGGKYLIFPAWKTYIINVLQTEPPPSLFPNPPPSDLPGANVSFIE